MEWVQKPSVTFHHFLSVWIVVICVKSCSKFGHFTYLYNIVPLATPFNHTNWKICAHADKSCCKSGILAAHRPFWGNKLSIRFHHILPGQLHQENDRGRRINYACPWPKAAGQGVTIHKHTHVNTHVKKRRSDVAYQFILLPKKFICLII